MFSNIGKYITSNSILRNLLHRHFNANYRWFWLSAILPPAICIVFKHVGTKCYMVLIVFFISISLIV